MTSEQCNHDRAGSLLQVGFRPPRAFICVLARFLDLGPPLGLGLSGRRPRITLRGLDLMLEFGEFLRRCHVTLLGSSSHAPAPAPRRAHRKCRS